MDDLNKTGEDVDQASLNGPPTTKLLKKKPMIEDEDAARTTPLTHRLADLVVEEEQKKQTGKGLIIAVAGVIVIVIGVVLYIFLGSGQGGIFSGGGADINTSGTDSMDARIVRGTPGAPAPEPGRAAAPNPAAAGQTAAPSLPPVQPAAGPASQPARTEPSSAPVSPAETREQPRAATPEPARPAAGSSKPESIQGGSDAAPSLGETAPKPASAAAPPSAPAAPTSLDQGFSLDQQPKVKEGDLVPLTGDVIKPEAISQAKPKMPPLAMQMRKTGQVILRILIDETGRVADARIVNENPKGFGFGKASLDAVQQFKYKPALKNNVRVKVWDTVFITFR